MNRGIVTTREMDRLGLIIPWSQVRSLPGPPINPGREGQQRGEATKPRREGKGQGPGADRGAGRGAGGRAAPAPDESSAGTDGQQGSRPGGRAAPRRGASARNARAAGCQKLRTESAFTAELDGIRSPLPPYFATSR